MSIQGYEDELRSERSYVAGLYTRLDAERARVKDRYGEALRGPIDVQDGGSLVARDAEVRALARQVKRLNVADSGLCFGRLDTLSGERLYIGRIGLSDDEYETLLLDWRAPASRAFYAATAAHPASAVHAVQREGQRIEHVAQVDDQRRRGDRQQRRGRRRHAERDTKTD
jgi:DNA helicase IV